MTTAADQRIDSLAHSCVSDMGDIFWDFDPVRDAACGFADPCNVAVASVRKTLQTFADETETAAAGESGLTDEYETVIAGLAKEFDDSDLTGALVAHSDWTPEGSRELIHVARKYGSFFLRNALSLAKAMDIEDGEAGF